MLNKHPSIANDQDGDFTNNVENLEGLFKVRLGAFVTKKGGATFEKKTYESIESTVQAFLKDVYDILMIRETFGPAPR